MKQVSCPERERALRRPFPTPPSVSEIAALLKEASKEPKAVDVRDVVNILNKTGMRRGELRDLRWRDVDFAEKVITLNSDKNGKLRRVPIGAGLLETLRQRRERQPDSDYILGASPHSVLDRVARRVGVLSERIIGRRLNECALGASREH